MLRRFPLGQLRKLEPEQEGNEPLLHVLSDRGLNDHPLRDRGLIP